MEFITKQKKAKVVDHTKSLQRGDKNLSTYEVRGSGKYYDPQVKEEVYDLAINRAVDNDLLQGGGYYDRKVGGKKMSVKKQMESEFLSGSGFWDDFKEGFDMVMKPAASIAKTIVPGASVPLSLLGYGKQQKRGQLIKQVMKSRGVSLGEASRIIKNENLM
jgi:hypothetical protein